MPSEPKSRLAVMWFADIAGYTVLSNQDEAGALQLVAEFERLTNKAASSHGGRVAKRMGDGALAAFESIEPAVRAALDLRSEFAASVLAQGTGCSLRLGVHLGDVTEKSDGDLLGQDVNIASRVHSAAQPGQIVVTEEVSGRLRRRRDYDLRLLGSFKVKGLDDPLELWALVTNEPGSEESIRATSPILSVPVPTTQAAREEAMTPVYVDAVLAPEIDEHGMIQRLVLVVANDGQMRASRVKVTVAVENDGSSVQQERTVHVRPKGHKEVVLADRSAKADDSLTVHGEVRHLDATEPYCYKFDVMSGQFVPCDDDLRRHYRLKVQSGVVLMDAASASLVKRSASNAAARSPLRILEAVDGTYVKGTSPFVQGLIVRSLTDTDAIKARIVASTAPGQPVHTLRDPCPLIWHDGSTAWQAIYGDETILQLGVWERQDRWPEWHFRLGCQDGAGGRHAALPDEHYPARGNLPEWRFRRLRVRFHSAGSDPQDVWVEVMVLADGSGWAVEVIDGPDAPYFRPTQIKP